VVENKAKCFAVRFALAVDVSAQEQGWLALFLRVPGRAVRREILIVNALLLAAFEITPERRVFRFDFRFRQFAGQRTDMKLQPVGDPFNLLVRLNDDTLPSPEALMVTGITPQQTVADGYTEAEFAQILINDVFTEDTITVGFAVYRFRLMLPY